MQVRGWLVGLMLTAPVAGQSSGWQGAERAAEPMFGGYFGSFSAQSSPILNILDRDAVRNALNGQNNRSFQGSIQFHLVFYGSSVHGDKKGSFGIVTDRLNGTVDNGICTLFGQSDGSRWQGPCGPQGFSGTINVRSGRMQFHGSFSTRNMEYLTVAEHNRRTTQTHAANLAPGSSSSAGVPSIGPLTSIDDTIRRDSPAQQCIDRLAFRDRYQDNYSKCIQQFGTSEEKRKDLVETTLDARTLSAADRKSCVSRMPWTTIGQGQAYDHNPNCEMCGHEKTRDMASISSIERLVNKCQANIKVVLICRGKSRTISLVTMSQDNGGNYEDVSDCTFQVP